MIGHFVLHHVVTDSEDVLALWHIDADGVNTGAWIVQANEAFTDPAVARRLVELCADRLLIDWAPSLDLVRRLEAVAGTPARRWVMTTIRDALAEIVDIRADCLKRVEEQRAENKAISPLEWLVDLPDPLPRTEEELYRCARLRTPSFDPGAAAGVLQVCRLVRWMIQRWRETTVVAERRTYLRQEFGELGALPPQWLSAGTDAMADHPAMHQRRGT
ncbi:DUF6218 family protein [Lentzea sp. NPDC051213]|uniref:DUF6218 family protein n=1 Tax=Lentzea sp. NPDC051213 TaxID=3364126 RepID=UPI0037994B20